MKVYIKHGNSQYTRLFLDLGYEIAFEPEQADLVCFTGGADVTPSLYGAVAHKSTFNDAYRDAVEKELFQWCVANHKPMVGICRGGQFLNVMSGGEMYQDVTGHLGSHHITDTVSGETVYVSSTHHQMMKPSKDGVIVATSINILSDRIWFENQVFQKDESDVGIEVVYYPTTRCLCFQPHPEFDGYPQMRSYFSRLLHESFEM